MSTNILITGGNGFIGSHLRNRLLSTGHKVTIFSRSINQWSLPISNQENLNVIQGDLCDKQTLSKALKAVEIVFHKASSYGSPTSDNSQSLYDSNVKATECLLAALATGATKVRKVICSSSISVYGEGLYECKNCGKVRPDARTSLTIKTNRSFDPVCPNCSQKVEPAITPESANLNGASAYARSKIVQEQLLEAASRELGITVVNLRYATVYGAFQRHTNFYTRFINSLLEGSPVTINEDGKQRRDFVYIDDVVRANELAMQTPLSGCTTLNIGTEEEVALVDFVMEARALVEKEHGKLPGAVDITKKFVEGDIRNCKIDCSRASQILGFKPETHWLNGLKQWLSILAKLGKCQK